jgi:hypothetical protein
MDWLTDLFDPVRSAPGAGVDRLVLALLVALIVSQFTAWCYRWTHRGVSYSRTFTQALILIAMIAALSMFMVSSNPLVALGLLGGMAIIRFRTVVRDARDTSYVFLSLICGMACGFGYHGIAIVGCLAANLVAIYLHVTGFGAWHSGNGTLRVRLDSAAVHRAVLDNVLARFCRRYSLISLDEAAMAGAGGVAMCQCAYEVRLRSSADAGAMIAAIKAAAHVEAIHLLAEQEHEEVA